MSERRVHFKGASHSSLVRAIVAGRKTMMRCLAPEFEGRGDLDAILRRYPHQNGCPLGQAGDRLWVPEGWKPGRRHTPDAAGGPKVSVMYRADSAESSVAAPTYELANKWHREFEIGDEATDWRPSSQMPRWAARMVLEITEVRVERLQSISYEDAAAEGVYGDHRVWSATDEGGVCHKHPQEAFRDLWTATGGDWDSNPWVWVIAFKQQDLGA